MMTTENIPVQISAEDLKSASPFARKSWIERYCLARITLRSFIEAKILLLDYEKGKPLDNASENFLLASVHDDIETTKALMIARNRAPRDHFLLNQLAKENEEASRIIRGRAPSWKLAAFGIG